MAAFRFSCLAGSLLILASAVPAWSQNPESQDIFGPASKAETGCCCEEAAAGPIRKTYSLADMGDDPKLGAWIAEMLPQVVQPGTWNTGDAPHRRVLSYYAPAKMLLVYHTPAVHAEIDGFLRGIKKSLPTTQSTVKAPSLFGLAQTQFVVPAAHSEPMSGLGGYPVPAQTAQPKHLFHFIIRYEGAGVIDRNVVEFTKSYAAANTSVPSAATETKSTETKSIELSAAPVVVDSPATCTTFGPLTSSEMRPTSTKLPAALMKVVTPVFTAPGSCATECRPASAPDATATATIPASTPAPAPGPAR
jgi:hypothetical protein